MTTDMRGLTVILRPGFSATQEESCNFVNCYFQVFFSGVKLPMLFKVSMFQYYSANEFSKAFKTARISKQAFCDQYNNLLAEPEESNLQVLVPAVPHTESGSSSEEEACSQKESKTSPAEGRKAMPPPPVPLPLSTEQKGKENESSLEQTDGEFQSHVKSSYQLCDGSK